MEFFNLHNFLMFQFVVQSLSLGLNFINAGWGDSGRGTSVVVCVFNTGILLWLNHVWI